MRDALILVDHHHPATTILTLNRPEKRNALSTHLLQALCDAIADAEADAMKRVLIIRGLGPAFSAGLDLAEAMHVDVNESAPLVGQTLRSIYESRLISIAAVHGTAAAGGAGLMSACDLVVVADNARIGYPEVHRGLIAALVMGFLYRQVGERRARELVLLGQFVEPSRALEMGLVNRVVPSARLEAESFALADAVLKGGPIAVSRTKALIDGIAPRSLKDELERAIEHHIAVRRSAEADEGLAAFNEKRKPTWQTI